MTIPLPPIDFPNYEVPQVTPFTYRDGATMLKKLDYMQKYINRELIPWVEKNTSDISEAFETTVNALIESVNAAIDIILNDSVEIQDPLVAQMIADINSQTHAAILLLGDSRYTVYRQWNGTSYPARIAGAANLYIGPTQPAGLTASDYWLNPNFVTLATTDPRYTIHRVWDGTQYPPRVAGAVNIFIGATDPGLLMSGNDLWANPNVTTMDAVVAAMNDPGSPLYIATSKVVDKSIVATILPASTAVVMGTFGVAPNTIYALSLPKDGNTNSVRFMCSIPLDWNSVTVTAYWLHTTGSGAMRMNMGFTASGPNGPLINHTTTQDRVSAGAEKINKSSFSNRQVTPGGVISGTISRLAGSGTDTIAEACGVVAVEIARAG